MRIKSITTEYYEEPVSMYDVVDVKPYHNFEIVTNSNRFLVSHNSVLERMGSRFMVNGKIAGKLFIVSSKKSEYDFLESYIRKQKGKPGVMVCDAKLWEVKPEQTYCGKTFNVAIGGANRASKIVPDDEDPETYMKQGYEIIEVPIEFHNRFEIDIQAAIMNIAGISISNSTRFISYENLARCYRNGKNPFDSAILTIGMYDTLRIQDFFHPEEIPPEIYTRPIFVHIDTSLTGDKTGISAIAVMGYKNVNEYSIQSGDIETTKELYYHHIFSVAIQCPSSSEISFQKTRDFIYFLKYHCNWNIRAISTDGFQSADTRQQLITMGFEDTKLISLDRSPDGYITYKASINEQRISHLHIPELEFEIINLARDNQTGRIDHDVDKCFTGDTKIKLVDGRDLTILELMQEQEYKTNWVYTFNEEKQIIEPKPIKKVFWTKQTECLTEITLNSGDKILSTTNHRYLLNDNSYLEASKLKIETHLKAYDGKDYFVIGNKTISQSTNVYDLEIQDNHNFSLSCGIIVHNSKDISDSLAGAVYNASLHEQELNLGASDMYEIIFDTNKDAEEDDDRLSLLQKILPQIKSPSPTDAVQDPISTTNNQPSSPNNPFDNDDSGFFFL